MKEYRHLFFDLDHTLWDFEKNAEETLQELYIHYDLAGLGVPDAPAYIKAYREINTRMWAAYQRHQIDKETLRSARFTEALKLFGVPEEKMPGQMWEDYLAICPTKTNLFPHSIEILEYLHGKEYSMSLITNGFSATQEKKVQHSGLEKFFKAIISSESVGYQKPHPVIFEYALNSAGVGAHESIMIGDNLEVDVEGALNAGLDAIWFSPDDHSASHERAVVIRGLAELRIIL